MKLKLKNNTHADTHMNTEIILFSEMANFTSKSMFLCFESL